MSDSNSDIIDIPPENVVDHEAQSKSAEQTKPPRQRNSSILLLGIAGGLIAVSAIGGGWAYRDLLSSYFPSDSVLALMQRVDALDAANKESAKKLDAVVGVTDEIKSQAGAAQSAAEEWKKQLGEIKDANSAFSQSITELQTAVGDAQSQLKALDEKLKNAPVTAGTASVDVGAIEQRLTTLEKELAALKSGGGVDNAALSQTLADLKGKIADGSAFAAELDHVRASVPAADGVNILEKYASQGVANLKTLQDQLKTVVAQLPKQEAPALQPDNSWSGWFSRLFSDVITVRDQGDPDWQILGAKADAYLASGDLAQASGLFDNQSATVPAGLKQWHEAAQARLELDAALDKVSAAVLRRIAAKG